MKVVIPYKKIIYIDHVGDTKELLICGSNFIKKKLIEDFMRDNIKGFDTFVSSVYSSKEFEVTSLEQLNKMNDMLK